MISDHKLRTVMGSVLGVAPEAIDESSSPDSIESWDSLQQLNLILALEEEFGVVIPDEEAADLTSFPLIRLVLEEQLQAA